MAITIVAMVDAFLTPVYSAFIVRVSDDDNFDNFICQHIAMIDI